MRSKSHSPTPYDELRRHRLLTAAQVKRVRWIYTVCGYMGVLYWAFPLSLLFHRVGLTGFQLFLLLLLSAMQLYCMAVIRRNIRAHTPVSESQLPEIKAAILSDKNIEKVVQGWMREKKPILARDWAVVMRAQHRSLNLYSILA